MTKLSLNIGMSLDPSIEDPNKPIFVGFSKDGLWLGEGVEGVKWISPKKARKLAAQFIEIAEIVEAKNVDKSLLNGDTSETGTDGK